MSLDTTRGRTQPRSRGHMIALLCLDRPPDAATCLRPVMGLRLDKVVAPDKFYRIIRRAIALCEYRISPNLRLAFSIGGIGKLPHSRHWRAS